MARRRHYASAPITEALIDISVELPKDTKVESLNPVYDRVKTDYPTRENRFMFEGQLSAGAEVAASAKQTNVGYLFRSTDGKQVLQARVDGFTFSRLKPYENWNALRDEARRLWRVFREVVTPIRITRVAVRYINQIDIPLPMRDFKDYLRTLPEISPELPQGLSGFLMRLQIPQSDLDALLFLTQTMVPPPKPDTVSVILDIDLFKGAKNGADLGPDEDAWALLERFRDRKNEVFEGCITDDARRLFGPVTE